MATIVLVHGAWHGAWCWYKVVTELDRLGHTAIAEDLPGHGISSNGGRMPTFRDYVISIAAIVERCADRPILVGHSMSGGVIGAVGEKMPGRIAKLVYLTAVLGVSGQSGAEAAGVDETHVVTKSSSLTPDGTAVVFDAAGLRSAFYHDCPEEDVTLAKMLLKPQSIEPMGYPVVTTAARFGLVPKAYIECSNDVVLPLARQRAMVAATPCAEIVTLSSAHSPFFAAPRELAEALDQLCRSCVA